MFKSPSFFAALLFALLCCSSLTQAQTDSANKATQSYNATPTSTTPQIYKMNYWTVGGLCVLGTAGNLYAIPNILHAKKPITDVELSALKPDVYNGIDHVALEQDASKRTSFKKTSDLVLPVAVVSAALLAADKNIRKDGLRIFVMYFETQAVTFSLYNFSPFGPGFQNRFRPLVYYNQFTHEERTVGGNRNSFFSGHTANVAASTFFMAKVYSDYHPELGGKKYLLYGLAALPPIVEGYLRVKALEHFPSDVAAGLIVGAVTGVVVPALHRIHSRDIQLGVTYSGTTGAGMRMTWRPTATSKKVVNTFHSGS